MVIAKEDSPVMVNSRLRKIMNPVVDIRLPPHVLVSYQALARISSYTTYIVKPPHVGEKYTVPPARPTNKMRFNMRSHSCSRFEMNEKSVLDNVKPMIKEAIDSITQPARIGIGIVSSTSPHFLYMILLL
jgi:hypothetical protein